MLLEANRENLVTLLLCWGGLIVILTTLMWRSRQASGLPLVYAFWLSVMHVFAALIYTLPYYQPRSKILIDANITLSSTYAGFRIATIGLAGFVVGMLLFELLARPKPLTPVLRPPPPMIFHKLPGTMLLIGILAFFIFGPLLRGIPSVGSLRTAAVAASVVGVFLLCWMAYQRKQIHQFVFWLVAALGFPMVTIIFMGFATFGAAATITVWMMVVRFFRPRWVSFLALIALIYVSMTFYVNWMAEREAIRSSVWNRQGLEQRFEKFSHIIEEFEFFDLGSQAHLELVDLRLNQNDLVGKAVKRLGSGRMDFLHGETLYLALVAPIPRILWPGKPVVAGSGNTVSRLTGVVFAEGTSVGAGQVLEFYGNFGQTGMFISFTLFAMLLRFFDWKAAPFLQRGDYWKFTCWLLPGMALLHTGGMVSEMVGSLATNTVFLILLHQGVFKKYYTTDAVKQTPARTHYRDSIRSSVKPERIGRRPS